MLSMTSRVVGDELDASSLPNQHDIASLTRAVNDQQERKRQRHRADMVEFRKRKKEMQQRLVCEHDRLKRTMKSYIGNVRHGTTSSNVTSKNSTSITAILLRELVVEREALQSQNSALRETICRHKKLQQAFVEGSHIQSVYEDVTVFPINEKTGFRVHFAGGEPSFHFHPFTRDELNSFMTKCAANVTQGELSVKMVGQFLGWKVHHSFESSVVRQNSLLARSRFTKRVDCSIKTAFEAMLTEEKDSWPVIVSPMNWGGTASGRVNTQVLQEFDSNSCVLVRNIQDRVNLRYLCLCERARWIERDDKRAVTYAMVIADSKANERSRSAEALPYNIEWATEGGAYLTLEEVDENTTDVIYDHWAGCESDLHAQYLFIQWADFAVRWEQMVLPTTAVLVL